MQGLMVSMLLSLVRGLIIPVYAVGGIAYAAETLKIDGMSDDPKQFHVQVEQLLTKTDSLIAKLRGNPTNQAMVLDLLQTRDDILRELPKIDSAPGDAKWTADEMLRSVKSKLKLLKDQYDKASVGS
jgi:hypothetical protein